MRAAPRNPRYLVVLVVALTALLIAVLALTLADGGEDQEVGAGKGAQPGVSATGSPTPEATATASVSSPLTGPISDGFARRELAPNDIPDREYGIVLADLETGQGEFWSVDSAEEGARYGVDPTHRWLWAVDSGRPPRWIVADRRSGDSYALDLDEWQVVAGPTAEGMLLVNRRESAAFTVVDLSQAPPVEVLAFTLPAARADISPRAILAGRHLFVAGWDEDSGRPGINTSAGRTRLFEVDLSSGEVSPFRDIDAPGLDQLRLYDLDDDGLLVVAADENDDPDGVVARRFDANGPPFGEWTLPEAPLELVPSPDGRWLAWQEFVYGPWPAVVIADTGGRAATRRILPAVLPEIPPAFLDEPHRRVAWLSDSSGLLVHTAAGFGLLRPEGGIDDLPLASDIPEVGWPDVPVPAGREPSLLVYQGRLVNLGGQLVGPEIAASEWAAIDSWNLHGLDAIGSELHLIRSTSPQTDTPGTIGAFPNGSRLVASLGLDAKLDTAPFEDELRLRVDTGDEGLNVRATPGLLAGRRVCYVHGDCGEVAEANEEARGSLPDATLVTITEVLVGEPQVEAVWVTGPGESTGTWWLHMQAENGLQGWVSVEYLTRAE